LTMASAATSNRSRPYAAGALLRCVCVV
jgi:hypothetical protein